MRLIDWPRTPFLNEEVREWIALELENLGVEDLAVYALEAGTEGDERRVLVATEVGLLDHRYAPYGTSATYRLAMLLYPWQTLRGVELRSDTFRVWAREHRTRWAFRLHHPVFEAATDAPDLGQALCDLARVCAVMAEPFGVPAARSSAVALAAPPASQAPFGAPSADRAHAIPIGEPAEADEAPVADVPLDDMPRSETPPTEPERLEREPQRSDLPRTDSATPRDRPLTSPSQPPSSISSIPEVRAVDPDRSMENGHAPREGAELVEQPRQRGEAPPAHATRWPFHRSRSGPADDEEILLGPEPD